MDSLKIKNWDKWQTYRRDRGQPPWIKVHRRILRNPEFISMTDAERGQLLVMWLLAADKDGVIPASPDLLQKLCFMTDAPNLNKFTDLQFIEDTWRQDGVKMASNGSQCDAPKAKAKAKAESSEAEAEAKPPIREKPIKKKTRYLDEVRLTGDEYQKLLGHHGQDKLDKIIELLNNHKKSKGVKYKSDYHAILKWVIAAVEEKARGNPFKPSEVERLDPGSKEAHVKPEETGSKKKLLQDYKEYILMVNVLEESGFIGYEREQIEEIKETANKYRAILKRIGIIL